MKTKYLITCAGSKQEPKPDPSKLENLSFHDKLGRSRQELIELLSIHLNWNNTLPAWKLYSGRRSKMYPKVGEMNWRKNSTDVRILSALFGWVRHTDKLPYYDLRMSDKIDEINQRVNKFWLNKRLLHLFIEPTDIDLLSGDYRKAIHGKTSPVSTIPNEHFTDYGVQKGIWLNRQLNENE